MISTMFCSSSLSIAFEMKALEKESKNSNRLNSDFSTDGSDICFELEIEFHCCFCCFFPFSKFYVLKEKRYWCVCGKKFGKICFC